MAGWRAGEPPKLRRLDPRPLEEAKEHIEGLREELGTKSTPRIDAAKRIADAARDLEDTRKHLLAVMKALDHSETRSLHIRVGAILLQIDDLRSVLTEHNADE